MSRMSWAVEARSESTGCVSTSKASLGVVHIIAGSDVSDDSRASDAGMTWEVEIVARWNPRMASAAAVPPSTSCHGQSGRDEAVDGRGVVPIIASKDGARVESLVRSARKW